MKHFLAYLFIVSTLFSGCNFSDHSNSYKGKQGGERQDLTATEDSKRLYMKESERPAMFFYKHMEGIKTVAVAGSFNEWSKDANPMILNLKSGYWELNLRLAPGAYQYKFVINDTDWRVDPYSPEEWIKSGIAANDYNAVIIIDNKDAYGGMVEMVREEGILFTYKTTDARVTAVSLIADFTDWTNRPLPMKFNQETKQFEVRAKPNDGIHHYKFILYTGDLFNGIPIDYQADPKSPKDMLVADGMGGFNSVIVTEKRISATVVKKGEGHTFTFLNNDERVNAVYVMGSFNEWSKRGNPLMLNTATGEWEITLKLPPGIHYYKFVIAQNDTILEYPADPKTAQEELFDDGFGNLTNTRLVVREGDISAMPIAAGKGPVVTENGILFTFKPVNPLTTAVYLAGDFTEWDKNPIKMTWNVKNAQYETLVKLIGGRHTYKFVTYTGEHGDQLLEWMEDPSSSAKDLVSDDNNGLKSVIVVEPKKVAEVPFGQGYTFTLKDTAQRYSAVVVAGDFNDWDKRTNQMTFNREKKQWEITLALKEGIYVYKFFTYQTSGVMSPLTDPTTTKEYLVDDGYGNFTNSLLMIGTDGKRVYYRPASSAMFYYCSVAEISKINVAIEYYGFAITHSRTAMSYNRTNGCWELNMTLPNDRYEYQFAITYSNGKQEWTYDPRRSSPSELVPNKIGTGRAALNSLITIGPVPPSEFTFRFPMNARTISKVYLVGGFNLDNSGKWKLEDARYQMRFNASTAHFEITVKLPRGRHAYKFYVVHTAASGKVPEYVFDTRAKVFEDDGYGGTNSVIVVR